MKDLVTLVGIVLVYHVLMRIVLPQLGISTCSHVQSGRHTKEHLPTPPTNAPTLPKRE